MQVEISTRHGHLDSTTQSHIEAKAQRLLRLFERLTRIGITVDLRPEQPEVEFVVSAEHKHDFVARGQGVDVLAAVDLAIEKVEQQLRKYKEKVQDHRRTPPMGDIQNAPA